MKSVKIFYGFTILYVTAKILLAILKKVGQFIRVNL